MTQVKFDASAPVILANCELSYKHNNILTILVFDTGSTYTMISWAIAKKLGLQPQKAKDVVPFSTASGHVEAPLVETDKVTLQEAEVKNVKLIVHDLPEDSRVDGLLGLNFLQNFLIKLDFTKGLITLK